MARKIDEEKRCELAHSAFEVMRRKGVPSTTMSSLAKELNMKRSTLYWYFKDLNAIFEVVLHQLLEEVELHVQEKMSHFSHPIDILYQLGVGVHDYFSEHEDMLVLLFQLWATGGGKDPNQVFQQAREYNQPRRQMLVVLIENGIEEGLVMPCDAERLVHAVSAFTDGLLVNRVAGLYPAAPLQAFLWESLLAPLKKEKNG